MAEKEKKGLSTSDLNSLGALFEQAKELPDNIGYENLPDGIYTCFVQGLELTKSESTGKPMAKWTFKVAEGEEYQNRVIFKNQILEASSNDTNKANNMQRFRIDVKKFYDAYPDDLGTFPGDFNSFIESLPKIVNQYCYVSLKTASSGRQNAKIVFEDADTETED